MQGVGVRVDQLYTTDDSKHFLKFIQTPATLLDHILEQKSNCSSPGLVGEVIKKLLFDSRINDNIHPCPHPQQNVL